MASSSRAALPATAVQPTDTSHFDLALLEKALPSKEDNASEAYPLVTLVHPNGVAETGHIALAADLHFLGSSSPPEKRPTSLLDFSNSRTQHFAVERLEVEDLTTVRKSLKRVDLRGKHGVQFSAVCLHTGIRNMFQGLVRNDKPEPPRMYTVLLDTEEVADSMREMLEPRVLSWTALEENMRNVHRQFEQRSREGEEQSAGLSTPQFSCSAVEHLEHATVDKVIELAAKANAGASWGSAVTAAVAAVASGAEMSDALARSLGGVAFVGPALQLAAFITRAANVVVKAKSIHKDLIPVYARLQYGMREIVGVMCHVGQGHAEGDNIVHELFGSLHVCWGLMQQAERILLGGIRKRLRSWNAVAEFCSDLEKLENHLEKLGALKYTAMLDRKISSLQRNVAGQNARLSRVEQVSSGKQAREDIFVASYVSVPSKRRLRRFVPNALPALELVKSKLRRTGSLAVTGEGGSNMAGGTVVVGQGGVGKTTACVAVCHAEDVRIVFEDGIYFFEFELFASDAYVADMLCSAVRDSGGYATAYHMERKFEKHGGEGDPIMPLVREARKWFAGRSALFVFDNIYFRKATKGGVKEWPSVLIDIIGDAPKSAVLVSTRARTLVNEVVESRVDFGVLDKAKASEGQAAMDLMNRYASDKFGEPMMPLSDEQKRARCRMLKICGGLQLAICIAGNMVMKCEGGWVRVCSSLERTRDALLNDEIDTVAHHIGLSSVMKASLEVLDDKNKDRGRFEGHTQSDLREVYGEQCFARLYARFGLLESARSVPVDLVHVLFGGNSSGKASTVKAVARLFEEFGLATVRTKAGNLLVIELHDMEHFFAKSSLESCGGRHSAKFGAAHQHRAFLKTVAKTVLRDEKFGAEIDWSRLWDESGEYWRAARSYMKSNLIRHMLEGTSDAGRTRECCCGESSCCVPSVELVRKCLVALFCDFRWIRARALCDGRSALLGDFTRVLRTQARGGGEVPCAESVEDESGVESGEPALQRGEFAAIEHIYRLCCLLHRTCLEVGNWRCQEHICEGGDMASGILRGINGDDVYGSDDRLDDDGKRESQEVLSRLVESIRVNVKGPYLRLLRPFVGSVVEGMAKGAVREFQWGLSACDSLLSLPETFGVLAYQGSTGALCIQDMRNLSAAPDILVSDVTISGIACTTALGEPRANFLVSVTKTCTATIWRICLSAEGDREVEYYATLKPGRSFSAYLFESATCVALSKGARVVAVGTDKGVIILSHKVACCKNGEIIFTRGARIDAFNGAIRSLHLPHDEPWAVVLSQGGELKRWCSDEDVRCSLFHDSNVEFCRLKWNVWAAEFVGDSSAYTVERGMAVVTKVDIATEQSTVLIQASQDCSEVTALAVLVGRESALVVCVGRRDGRVECWTDFGGERECVLGISVDTGSEVVSTALLWRQAGGTTGRSRRVFDVVSMHVDGLCRVATGVVLGDGTTALWDDVCVRGVVLASAGSGRREGALCNGVNYLAASARGDVVVSGHQDGSLMVWDVRTGALRGQMKENGSLVLSVDVSDDCSVAVCGGGDKCVRVWELGVSSRERHVLREHKRPVSRVLLCHGTPWAVSGDCRGSVRVWDIERGTCLDVKKPSTALVRSLGFASCLRTGDPSNGAEESAVADAAALRMRNNTFLSVAVQDKWHEVALYRLAREGTLERVHSVQCKGETRFDDTLRMHVDEKSTWHQVPLGHGGWAPVLARDGSLNEAAIIELPEVLPGIISLESQAIACGCSPRDAVLRSTANPRLAASQVPTLPRLTHFGIQKKSHFGVVCTEKGSLRIYEVVNFASGLKESPRDATF